jgi:hypothetical protein
MNTNRSRTITIFIALTIAGVGLVVFGQGSANETIRVVLPFLGAAIFGSGLTYFMVKLG